MYNKPFLINVKIARFARETKIEFTRMVNNYYNCMQIKYDTITARTQRCNGKQIQLNTQRKDGGYREKLISLFTRKCL